MSTYDVCMPILQEGIRSTNFFNGRRLTAEDLQREQNANRDHDRRLGQAIGEGIVTGLEVAFPDAVTSGGTTVSVKAGLAVNRAGDVLRLADDIELTLVPLEEELDTFQGFVPCETFTPLNLPTGDGIYVLLMKPAAGLEGSAPIVGIKPPGKIVGCGKSDVVEGVQFRVVKMAIEDPAFAGLGGLTNLIGATDIPSVSKLRSRVAHACFGTSDKARLARYLFSPGETADYGALDRLRSDKESSTTITESDVPIAVFYWTSTSITSIDTWSVRRRPYQIDEPAKWPLIADPRRMAEAEAVMRQFQEQLSWLQDVLDAPSLAQANEYFSYLPPVGLLPIQRASAEGFDADTFFAPMPHRPAPPIIGTHQEILERSPQYIDGRTIDSSIRQAISFPPIPIEVDEPKLEMIWIHYPWQNVRAIEAGDTQRHYLLFMSGHVPPPVITRFDVARWDYSNYERRGGAS